MPPSGTRAGHDRDPGSSRSIPHDDRSPVGLRPRPGGGTPRAIARIERARDWQRYVGLLRCFSRRRSAEDPDAGAGLVTATAVGARAGEPAARSTIERGGRLKRSGTHPLASVARGQRAARLEHRSMPDVYVIVYSDRVGRDVSSFHGQPLACGLNASCPSPRRPTRAGLSMRRADLTAPPGALGNLPAMDRSAGLVTPNGRPRARRRLRACDELGRRFRMTHLHRPPCLVCLGHRSQHVADGMLVGWAAGGHSALRDNPQRCAGMPRLTPSLELATLLATRNKSRSADAKAGGS